MMTSGTDEAWLVRCRLCPRKCGANRMTGRGRCGAGDQIRVARAALHMWEEPCLSGNNGSGAVFFTGCSLGCVYCQNARISGGVGGIAIEPEQLAEIFLRLQDQGAHNINLVTAGHYLPLVVRALRTAKEMDLRIPVVYNSSGYETVEAIRQLEGLVDVYLPDLKYLSSDLAAAFSHAPDYPEVAKAALAEMVRQIEGGTAGEETAQPDRRTAFRYDHNGMMQRGVIVRHLLLPGHVREAKRVVQYLYETYGDRICLSLLRQYTPMPSMREHPQLGRKVTDREYDRLVDYALNLGITNGFIQEGDTAEESFIPAFDGEGISCEVKNM